MMYCVGERQRNHLPTRLLLLSVRLKAVGLLGVATAVRLRRLVGSGLGWVVVKRHPVAVVRALDARVAGAGLAQAHYRAAITILGLGVPQTLVSLVRAVVRVAAARAAADGEQPEEGGTD